MASVQHDQTSFWARLAEAIAAKPWRVICLWLLAFAAALPPAAALQDRLTPSREIAGTESAYVDQVMAERFGRDSRHGAVLIVAGLRPVHEPAEKKLLKSTVETVRGWPQVLRAHSIIDFPRGLMVGTYGTGALITLQLRPGADAQELEAPLDDLAAAIEQQSAGRETPLHLHRTGNFFLNADVSDDSERGAREGEIMALPLTLLILFAVFGSVLAALSAVVAVAVSIGIAGLSVLLLPWSPAVLMQNVISVIGLALTIDYSLLTVNRFRRETENGLAPRAAIVAAASGSAPTIMLAAFAVLVGFGALLVVPIEEIRAIGVGGVLASVMAAIVSITLLPAILGLLAPRLARGRSGGAKGRRFFASMVS